MEAYNALADEAAAEAQKAELKKQQELDQVQTLFCQLKWHTIYAHACCGHASYSCHAAGNSSYIVKSIASGIWCSYLTPGVA